VRAGAKAFAEEYPSVKVIAAAPESNAPNAQQQVVAGLVRRSIDALAIWPVDGAAMTGMVNDSVGRGIPVAAIGVDMADSKRIGFAGWDEQEVGRALADLAAEKILKGRTLMVLHSGARWGNLHRRWQALRVALDEQQRLVVLEDIDCGGSPARARQIISERMERYPELSGWISIEDWPLRQRNDLASLLPTGCHMVTCHPGTGYWSLARRHAQFSFVGTDYFDWGWRAVQLCYAAVRSVQLEVPMHYTEPEAVGATELGSWEQRWHRWISPGDRGDRIPTPR
jgi:hypothetical protein